jgi:hypothetical protein
MLRYLLIDEVLLKISRPGCCFQTLKQRVSFFLQPADKMVLAEESQDALPRGAR